MNAGISTDRQAQTWHRHDLRTLTYLTIEQANGGIVRNISQQGIGVQLMAPVRPRQQVHVRFELRHPRLRVETRGEVVWATFSGQCGIRLLDLPARVRGQINEWIFGDLLERTSLHTEQAGPIFAGSAAVPEGDAETSALTSVPEEDDGLLISAAPSKVIPLPVRHEFPRLVPARDRDLEPSREQTGNLDWLSQPLSPRGLAWTVDTLVVIAALLLFALVFLSFTREAPPWPVAMTAGSAVLLAVVYWGFFWVFGGESLGTRLARRAEMENK